MFKYTTKNILESGEWYPGEENHRGKFARSDKAHEAVED